MTQTQKLLALVGVLLVVVIIIAISLLLGVQIYKPPFIVLRSNISGVKISLTNKAAMEAAVKEVITNQRQTKVGESPKQVSQVIITLTPTPQSQLIVLSGENQIASSDYQYDEKDQKLTIAIYVQSLAQKTKITSSQTSNITDAFVTDRIFTALLSAIPPKTPPDATANWSISDAYQTINEQRFLKGKTTGTYPIHITVQ